MRVLKRLFVLLMVSAICIFGTSFAYAEDTINTPVSENCEGKYVTTATVVVVDGESDEGGDEGIMPLYYDNILSFCSTDFSWDGESSCVLGRTSSNCGIKAGISSNDGPLGTVECAVKFPNGGMLELGTVLTTGGMTQVKICDTLSSGTYVFYFTSSNDANLTGVGYIVQN